MEKMNLQKNRDAQQQAATVDELTALLHPKEKTILWVGAGVSIPAGFASAEALVEALRDAAKPDGGLPDCDDYLEATDAFVRLAGRGRLHDLLQAEYGQAAKPTVTHRALARLVKAGCFHTVITTNYDNLLERALEDEGVTYLTQVREDNINVLEGGAVRLLKPHGDGGNWSEAVLSGDSYRRFAADSKELVPQLDSLLKKHPVFFVGYSMLDPRTLCWLADLTMSQRSDLKRWRALLTEQSWSLAKKKGGAALANPPTRAVIVDNYEEHLPALLSALAETFDPPSQPSFRIEVRGDVATWIPRVGGHENFDFIDPAPPGSELAERISKLRDLCYRPVPTDEQGGLTGEGAKFSAALRQEALGVGSALAASLLAPGAIRSLEIEVKAAQGSLPVLLEIAVEATDNFAEAEAYADHILGLPWELLCINAGFPVEIGSLDIVREALVPGMKGLEAPTSPLVVVATVAAPEDVMALDYEGECFRIWKALGSSDERLQLTDRGMLSEFVDQVTQVRPPVVHFTGHGAPGALIFENEFALRDDVRIRTLLRELGTQSRPHTPSLIYLASCHGASTASNPKSSATRPQRAPRFDLAATDTAPSTAAALHRASFSQVVAYFGPVGDEQSTRMEAAFYGGLTEGLTARESIRSARAVSTGAHRDSNGQPTHRYPMGWSQIVLYHRGENVPTALTSDKASRGTHSQDGRKERRRSRMDVSSSDGGVHRLDFGFVGRRSMRAALLWRWSPKHDNQRVTVVAGLGGLGKSALCTEVLPVLARYLSPVENEAVAVMVLDARALRDRSRPIEGLWAQVAEFRPQGDDSDEGEWPAVLASAQEGGLTGSGLAYAVIEAARLAGGLLVYVDDAESLQKLPGDGDHGVGEWRDDDVAHFWTALVAAAREQTTGRGNLGLLASARYVPKGLGERSVLYIDAMRGVDLRRLMVWFESLSKLPSKVRERLAERVDGHPRTVEFLEGLITHELDFGVPKRKGAQYDRASLDWEADVIEPALGGLAEKLDADLLLPRLWNALRDEERELLGRCLALTGPVSFETLCVLGNREAILSLEHAGLLSPSVSHGSEPVWAPHHIVVSMVREQWKGSVTDAHTLLGHHFHERVSNSDRVAVVDATRAVEHLSLAGDGVKAWPIAEPLLKHLRKQGRYSEALGWCKMPLESGLSGPEKGRALAFKSQLSINAGASVEDLECDLELALKLVTAGDRPLVLSELGRLMNRLGRLGNAEKYEREDLALSTAQHGEEHPSTLASMNNLAGTLFAQGDLAGARQLQERSLDVTRRVLGEEHPSALTSLTNLAGTLFAQGDLAGARQLEERSLDVRRRVLGEEHPDTLTSLNNLAGTLQAQGDLAGARQLYEQALDVMRRVLGEEHPFTLSSLNNLAGTLFAQGDLAGARQLYEQSLDGRRRVLGEEHPSTLGSLNNLAGTLQAQGDLAGARQLYEQSLDVMGRVLGEEHPSTLTSLANLAGTLFAQGDLAGARQLEEQALDVERRVLGEEHPSTLTSMNNLAHTFVALGDISRALELVAQALIGAKKSWGDEHPNTKMLEEFFKQLES